MGNGFKKLTVRKRTKERLIIDVANEHKKNNPHLKHLKLTEDYLVSFLEDFFFDPYDVKGERNS